MPTPDCPLPTADTGCRVLEARRCWPTLVHPGGGGGGAVLSQPIIWRGLVLCRGLPRHRKGACGAVTAHQMPVAAWPRTVKRSESWALSLGFMACVLRMRPPECFLSIHFFELLRGVGGGLTPPPLFLGRKSRIFWFFLILSRKSVFRSRLHGVCVGRSGTSAYAVYALFSHFCYVGGFGGLSDPVLPTLRGVSGDVVTIYAN